MVSAASLDPVLVIGGSGVVGSRATRALRRLQPELPITVAGRDLGKAKTLADELGRADAVTIDLDRPDRSDLGLASARRISAVLVLLKDDSLSSMKYAQRAGIPYVSFSDWVFDIGPELGLFVQRPASAPILLLGHFLGGTITVATLHFAGEFRRVDRIAIGGVFDEQDVGGPAAAADMARLAQGVPRPLLLEDGRWLWADGEAASRVFRGADGAEWHGRAYPLLDTVSLAAATAARSIRVDGAVRPAASRPAGERPGFEVIVEIEGERQDGSTGRSRHVLVDRDVHAGMSALGAALAVERLLGLAGGRPVPPGLYHPAGLLDPEYVVEKLRAFGTRIERSEP
jgi:Saccharopine dehydrogenase NADP binding domain